MPEYDRTLEFETTLIDSDCAPDNPYDHAITVSAYDNRIYGGGYGAPGPVVSINIEWLPKEESTSLRYDDDLFFSPAQARSFGEALIAAAAAGDQLDEEFIKAYGTGEG